MTLPLDKMGQPYTPMSEAEKQVHRDRPYPEEFTRLSQMLRAREERGEVRRRADAEPESEATVFAKPTKVTLKRRVNARRKR